MAENSVFMEQLPSPPPHGPGESPSPVSGSTSDPQASPHPLMLRGWRDGGSEQPVPQLEGTEGWAGRKGEVAWGQNVPGLWGREASAGGGFGFTDSTFPLGRGRCL